MLRFVNNGGRREERRGEPGGKREETGEGKEEEKGEGRRERRSEREERSAELTSARDT
jgi:hypothetical protein